MQDSLPLFDNSIMDSRDTAINLSLDDLTGFAQLLGSGGMGQEYNSFDGRGVTRVSQTDLELCPCNVPADECCLAMRLCCLSGTMLPI